MIPRKFRFLDCVGVVEEKMLIIYDTFKLPCDLYAAVSYPWIGVRCTNITPAIRPPWEVQGSGIEGDPISVALLSIICQYAIGKGIKLLWIDRLCIDQVGKYDKLWQLRRMSEIYKQCRV